MMRSSPTYSFEPRLGQEAPVLALVGDHPVRLDPEKRLFPAGRRPHEQFQRPVSNFEVVAGVLEILQLGDDVADLLVAQFDTHLLGLEGDGRAPGHLRQDEAGRIADRFWVDVGVGTGSAGDRARVYTSFMGERRQADEGLVRVGCEVDDLGDVARNRGKQSQALVPYGLDAHLQAQVGDDRGQVGVAGPFAVTVDATLHMVRPFAHGHDGIGDCTTGIVMEMHPEPALGYLAGLGDGTFDLIRENAAVGVAEHGRCAAFFHDPEKVTGKAGIFDVPVEKMLRVDQSRFSRCCEGRPPSRRPCRVLRWSWCAVFQRRAKEKTWPPGRQTGARPDQVGHDRVRLRPAARFPGGAEGHEPGAGQGELAGGGPFEKLPVLRVRSRPTALYVLDAEQVELLGDPDLVVDSERKTLCLAAVAKRVVSRYSQLCCSLGMFDPGPVPVDLPPHGGLIYLLDLPGHRPGRAFADPAVVDRDDGDHLGSSAAHERFVCGVKVAAQYVPMSTSMPRSLAIVSTESWVIPSSAPQTTAA